MPKQHLTHKICPDCRIEKPRSEFYKKVDTISYRCKPCTLAKNKTNESKYFGKYSEYQNQWRKDKYKEDPEYRKKVLEQCKKLYDLKKEEINAKRRNRWATDPFNPARKHHRRKDVKGKTPPWVDGKEILKIYANCPPGHHVDHIIPLKGRVDGRPVSGLHVPWNLQYLTAAENLKKKNKISLEQILTLKPVV